VKKITLPPVASDHQSIYTAASDGVFCDRQMTRLYRGRHRLFYHMSSKVAEAAALEYEADVIRLLIVEGQPGVRRGLLMRLAVEADLAVIGEAANSEAALSLAAELQPDVILIDVDTPQLYSITKLQALRSLCPQFAVIMLSLQDDACTRKMAAEMGAAAFVVKSMPAATLLTTIRQIACQRGGGSIVPDLPTNA
jgi:CheY-like chemotaxis protein